MSYWLIKSEPSTYSIDDLVRDKKTHWEGVRNFQARNNLKSMKKGDLCLFYHSGEQKSVVGLAEVTREAYPDKFADEGDWVMVDVKIVKKLTHGVTLAQIKGQRVLKDIALVKQSRLSVIPLAAGEAAKILQMCDVGSVS